ncbi:MAG TPA: glycine betaine ABC transporter substrate-binding protein, partial [Kribbella sp.]|nr:glycine betaine ABC transporter substrate-binding protein [Kribbella sp.]
MKKLRYAGVLTAVALALATTAGCGGQKVGSQEKPAGGKECGSFNLTVSPWVGYEANAAVVSYVATKDLGCKVTKKNLAEQVAWQGFATGEVDVNLENWGHEDLKKKYIETDKVAVEAGSTGVKGVIGWYVPPWMAAKYPDITDWKNLNKYADLFKTSESGGKGQLLDG